MYEQVDYQLIDKNVQRSLGRKKRLEAQRRVFKKIPRSASTNNRHFNEMGKTIRGSARNLESYIEYPLLTLKKSQKAFNLGLTKEVLRPIGYSI